MSQEAILLPLLSMVALTFVVWNVMYIQRIGYMKRNRIHPQKVAERMAGKAELKAVAGSSDNFQNLLEMPILFYLLIVLLLVMDRVDEGYVGLAWTFVVLRVMHSGIHIIYNRVMHRFIVFAMSCVVLFVIWGRFALQTI